MDNSNVSSIEIKAKLEEMPNLLKLVQELWEDGQWKRVLQKNLNFYWNCESPILTWLETHSLDHRIDTNGF